MSEEVYAIAAQAAYTASREKDRLFVYDKNGVYEAMNGTWDALRFHHFKNIAGNHPPPYVNEKFDAWLKTLRIGHNRIDRTGNHFVKCRGELWFPNGISPINKEVERA